MHTDKTAATIALGALFPCWSGRLPGWPSLTLPFSFSDPFHYSIELKNIMDFCINYVRNLKSSEKCVLGLSH
ncbi:hypothetical protein ES319_D11G264100v1 [Gossypium barbadense]|uniref:Uncharacterized protein n=1 Tax=Gossypium barbadense TaxID=3634 RepID=A0A5J5PIK1_GOSBA|nr:hypothetical protein ES319_D11G264100v1 [Gossypium barbadense]